MKQPSSVKEKLELDSHEATRDTVVVIEHDFAMRNLLHINLSEIWKVVSLDAKEYSAQEVCDLIIKEQERIHAVLMCDMPGHASELSYMDAVEKHLFLASSCSAILLYGDERFPSSLKTRCALTSSRNIQDASQMCRDIGFALPGFIHLHPDIITDTKLIPEVLKHADHWGLPEGVTFPHALIPLSEESGGNYFVSTFPKMPRTGTLPFEYSVEGEESVSL